MEELVALAAERDLVLMPGHLLLYHPGVRKLKELVDSGELGESSASTATARTSGSSARDENALWSLGVHDLSVILYLRRRGAGGGRRARARRSCNPGVEDVVFCYLRFPSREGRAHAPLLARPAQDAQDDGRRAREDGRLRRHGARAQGDVYEKAPVGAGGAPTASGERAPATSSARRSRTTSRCGSSASTSCASSRRGARRAREARTGSPSCARSTG